MRPLPLEFVLKRGDYRTGQLDHRVVLLVAVFAPEIHAAKPRMGAIHQIDLRVVRGEPGVEKQRPRGLEMANGSD
jgi:hypothetical protein